MKKSRIVYVRAYVRRQICTEAPSFTRLQVQSRRHKKKVVTRFATNVLKSPSKGAKHPVLGKWMADLLMETWFPGSW